MKINSEVLIANLVEITRKNINQASKFTGYSDESLNFKENPSNWSILECIEHLNLYGDYYLAEIEHSIQNSKYEATATFNSGVLGNYFAKSMLPKDTGKKMQSPKEKNPIGSTLKKSTLDRFIKQQRQMLSLLDQARSTNLTKTKTAISISKLIKLRLGDTLRFVAYHNQRHLAQANKVVFK